MAEDTPGVLDVYISGVSSFQPLCVGPLARWGRGPPAFEAWRQLPSSVRGTLG